MSPVEQTQDALLEEFLKHKGVDQLAFVSALALAFAALSEAIAETVPLEVGERILNRADALANGTV